MNLRHTHTLLYLPPSLPLFHCNEAQPESLNIPKPAAPTVLDWRHQNAFAAHKTRLLLKRMAIFYCIAFVMHQSKQCLNLKLNLVLKDSRCDWNESYRPFGACHNKKATDCITYWWRVVKNICTLLNAGYDWILFRSLPILASSVTGVFTRL